MASRQERRAEWERQFKATHGVSSGTYYTMRRAAESRGISPKSFDAAARADSYAAAKKATQLARDESRDAGRYQILKSTGNLPAGMALSDFDSSMDYDFIPDDFDWWYH